MIRAEHIEKSFDGRKVLDDITVEFETGKTNLIIGRSGSGKTVLLKTLVGLHEPDAGSVWYDDTCFTQLGFRERKDIRKDIGRISRICSRAGARPKSANGSTSACSACGWPTPTGSTRPNCRAA